MQVKMTNPAESEENPISFKFYMIEKKWLRRI